MTESPPSAIDDRLYVLRTRWEFYVAEGRFEQFIEFAVNIPLHDPQVGQAARSISASVSVAEELAELRSSLQIGQG